MSRVNLELKFDFVLNFCRGTGGKLQCLRDLELLGIRWIRFRNHADRKEDPLANTY